MATNGERQKDVKLSTQCFQPHISGNSRTSERGIDWREKAECNRYEWPNLGLEVKEVIRVNPDNNNQETIKGGVLVRPQRDLVSTRLQI